MANPRLLSLAALTVVIAVLATIGYITYCIVRDVSNKTRAKMETKHHVSLSREGMKVEYKEVNDEQYKDKSQSVLVNMWNHTSFPNYKSRLWNMSGEPEKRRGYVLFIHLVSKSSY
ncbi:hypothetical protein ASPZODRAFT_54787 [Penicilliopsis zonata CBS 506.65]|uniref:Uncharacterized protein n=1 Tax=Penicilliopsis zonata CBS 506.65 TaxID=1073090 RepID=A0A1L9SW72_9EURO|nr:hypothetical protein ASPZODRAFT_54787 [Penicilliopsis zonata CBS 506.65]OJJ51452.1 hypothetical protein ASPZODRAFT_54787 [Penicilliopsis zonata CBS 506.65]